MASIQHQCGTPACIDGWSREIFGRGVYLALGIVNNVLDSDAYNKFDLVAPDNNHAWWGEKIFNSPLFITSKRAAKVLRNLAKTGEVDWSI